jgi:hypothetical protein
MGMSGAELPLVSMPVTSRHPEKYLLFDLETKQMWRWRDGMWVAAQPHRSHPNTECEGWY